jgi:glycosyltransferase involved in cell wall biosynthesis
MPPTDPAASQPRLRIAVVTPLFPSREQPNAGQAIYHTVLGLKRWAEVRVFCPSSRYPKGLGPTRFLHVRKDLSYQPPGVDTEYFEYPVLPRISRPFNGYACAGRLLPRVREWKPDLILAYWLYPEGFASVLAGRRLGVPVIVGSRGSDLRRIGDRATAYFTRRALREASGVITVSDDLRQHALRMGAPGDRVKTVLNGCDGDVFRPSDRGAARAELGIASEARLVLYVGRLDEGKGLGELLGAAERLRDVQDLLVVCLGEGVLAEALRQRAADAGLGGRVRFPGVCSRQGVARWMAACDLVCLPSYSEGCPNVVCEALACGRPVVSTTVGGIPDLVNERCGILVPAADTEQLAQALRRALDSPWDSQTIAGQFSRTWNDVAAETFEICSGVLRLTRG